MREVTDATFDDEVLAARVPVLVDFWAPWCKPCDAIEPHLRAVHEQARGRLGLVRVNIDESLRTSGRYSVLSLPTVILFVDGEPRERIVGARGRRHFERVLGPYLGE